MRTSDARDVSFRHLRAFLAVAETLSFTHAATQLDSNQPALTRSIQRLEEQLGVHLFYRTTRQVSLSPEGVKLREQLRVLLPRFEEALSPGTERPALRLGFSWLLPDGWVQDAIVAFERETEARVELRRRDDPGAGVDLGAVDVAILRGRPPLDGLRITPLGREEYVAVVAQHHPLAARAVVEWSELAGYPFVVNSVSGPMTDDDWPGGLRPRVALCCDNFDECLESVAAGRGVAVLPDLVLRRNLHPSVRCVPLERAPIIPISLVCPVQGAHPLAEHFTRVVKRMTSARGGRASAIARQEVLTAGPRR
ncbi:LysR family transcriptional regulator [Kitasatospora sp. GP82]|uniref:LysR family transcriptional regulator n=1 Tax=Kitasatospora sp. GP82 TaxID=3035089 RepID=UPI002476E20D|nr:LysR family transcriptional regulator [Kitasatospora sp. GP82]MDH6126842.1 DNA-binding transcriptional LysR family regulator [Kitasatospora sp. GP82]